LAGQINGKQLAYEEAGLKACNSVAMAALSAQGKDSHSL